MLYWLSVTKGGAKSSDEIRTFLRGIKDYEGVTGAISFDKFSENMPTHRMVEVKNGKFIEVHQFKKFTDAELE